MSLLWHDTGSRGIAPRLPPPPDWRPPPEPWPEPPPGLAAIDLETKDPDLTQRGPSWPWKGGYVVGISLAWDGFCGYFPIRHKGGGNLDPSKVRAYLKAIWARRGIRWAMANGGYDLGWLYADFGLPPPVDIVDVQVLAALLDEAKLSYSLDALGKEYLGQRKDDVLMKKAASALGLKGSVKDHLWTLPAAYVAPYAETDGLLTLALAKKLLPLIEAEGLTKAADLEHQLIPILLDMRRRGIKVNESRAAELGDRYRRKEQRALDYIKHQTGVSVSPWEPETIARALKEYGVVPPTTAKGAVSITKEWLQGLEMDIADAVLAARKYQKARGTFVEGHILGFARNGRVHAEFNPLPAEKEDGSVFGTVSYRFSCSNPNLQQLPGRDEELTEDLRGCFEPEEGEQWGSFDYSQQEPRTAIHYASVAGIPGAEDAVRAILEDPSWDFHDYASAMTGVPRKKVKTISLGRMYGMGDAELCRRLGLPVVPVLNRDGQPAISRAGRPLLAPGPEGADIIATYEDRFPWVSRLAEFCTARARDRGVIILVDGYRARFATRKGQRGDFPHKAMNRLIQASSAIQAKKAMILLHGERDSMRLLLQMHDEFGLSLPPDPRLVARAKEAMIEAVRYRVPMKVDAKLAANWGEASKED